MESIVFLVEQISIGLYVFIAVAIVWQVRKLSISRSEYRATYFELERDISQYQQVSALTAIILLIQASLFVLGIQEVVAPEIRRINQLEAFDLPASEDLAFNTPTPPPIGSGLNFDAPESIGSDDTVQIVVTPTLTPTPVGTIIPGAPPIVGCQNERAFLQVPTNGMRVFQPIPVVGTAFTDDFAFWRLEIKGATTLNNFAVIDGQNGEIREINPFSQFVPSAYEPGWYELRLAVFDITATLREVCMVNIYITEPFPTQTPVGFGN
jgi:hypothetical protein